MRLFALILALFLTSVVARAQPAEDPAVPAIRAAAATNWDVAYALAGDDQLARDVVSWMRLRKGDAIFADYQGFTPRRADWPGMVRLYIEGEELLPPETPTAQVIDWFGDRKPESGEGAVRLAEALIATAIGLFAAIPATVFYNIFVGRLRTITQSIELFGVEYEDDLRRMASVDQ